MGAQGCERMTSFEDPLRMLRVQRERLLRDLAKVDAAIAALDEDSDRIDCRTQQVASEKAEMGSSEGAPTPPAELREMAHAILAERKEPVPTGELLSEIGARGGVVGGVNQRANLSTLLSRDGRFHSNGRDGWVLSLMIQPDQPSLDRAAKSLLLDVRDDAALYDGFALHKAKYAFGLPKDVDRRLLEIASYNLGRRLTENEKHDVRGIARKLLDDL